MAGFIRSVRFSIGPNLINFTVQTDLADIDYRRRRLTEIIQGYTLDEFTQLGEDMFVIMRDQTFVFYDINTGRSELERTLNRLEGEVTLTRDWTAVHSYDIFMNIIFINQALPANPNNLD